MAGRKQKAELSAKSSSQKKTDPQPADVIIEATAEEITDKDIADTGGDETTGTSTKPEAAKPEHGPYSDPSPKEKSSSPGNMTSSQTKGAGRTGLVMVLAGTALLLGLVGAGMAGYSYQQISRLEARQLDMLAQIERIDQRIAEMADAALLQQQEEELNSFGRRLDDITRDFGLMLEQINAMGETITTRLAEPGREIIGALEKRLDDIDQYLSTLSSESKTTGEAKPDQADGAHGETPPSDQPADMVPSPSTAEVPSAEKEVIPEDAAKPSWMDWIRDFIRVERIDNSE